jgi:hypothetical protein
MDEGDHARMARPRPPGGHLPPPPRDPDVPRLTPREALMQKRQATMRTPLPRKR